MEQKQGKQEQAKVEQRGQAQKPESKLGAKSAPAAKAQPKK
jgi:hypothetical protein